MLVLKVVLKFTPICVDWELGLDWGAQGCQKRVGVGGLKKPSHYMGHKQIFVCVCVCPAVSL